MTKHEFVRIAGAAALVAVLTAGLATPVGAQQYRRELKHSIVPCQGSGPAVWLHIVDIKSATGKMRIELYPGTQEDWLERGRWLNRIEVPAQRGSMQICMPIPSPGDYAIAMRHDANDNNQTDITVDGGGMSNNPSINIFNLGRPSIDRTRFRIGREILPMTIRMRYL